MSDHMPDHSDMDCRQALDHLQDYLKREITSELALEIRYHLDRCRHCLHHVRFEENFLQLLATAGRVTCPDLLRARIKAALADAAIDP